MVTHTIVPTLGRLKLDHKFKARLCYLVRSLCKNKLKQRLGMVPQAFNLSTWEVETSRTAGDTQKNPVSKPTNQG